MLSIFLTVSIPILILAYATLDFFGLIDRFTGRTYAIQGLERLSDTGGYPTSFIEREKNENVFDNLYSRIIKHTRKKKVLELDKSQSKPSAISVAGKPIPVEGVPEDWEQNEKFYYSENYPILFLYDYNKKQDKAIKVCTLGDLSEWIHDEKESRDFWFNAFLIGLLSIILSLFQINSKLSAETGYIEEKSIPHNSLEVIDLREF